MRQENVTSSRSLNAAGVQLPLVAESALGRARAGSEDQNATQSERGRGICNREPFSTIQRRSIKPPQ